MKSVLGLLWFTGASLAGEELYFPPVTGTEWKTIQPADAGWNGRAIDEALTFAGSRRSSAVVILLHGRILAEKRWDPSAFAGSARFAFERAEDGQILEDVASVQKSVTSMLFGIARKKGLIRMEVPVFIHLGVGWSKAGPERESKILMRHLLSMSSGLDDSLAYEADAGTKWFYNTPAYQKTMRALANVSGKSENDVTREWLTGPIGMTHTKWRERAAMPGLLGLISTARDLARFGLLIQANGQWNGKEIIEDKRYIREALTSSQTMNPSYGLLWWLNGKPVRRANGATAEVLNPEAPTDMVCAIGAGGRYIFVVPSLGLVVTRTGGQADAKGEASFAHEFWKRLAAAVPAR